MKGALDLSRALLARDIPHEIVRLPRIILSAAELPEVLGLPADRCVVTLPYEVGDRLVVAAGLASDPPLVGAVRVAVGDDRMQPARVGVVNSRTDYAARLVAPLLLPPDVELLVDTALADAGVVYTATGDAGTALGIRAAHLLAGSSARVCDLAATPPPLPEQQVDLRESASLRHR